MHTLSGTRRPSIPNLVWGAIGLAVGLLTASTGWSQGQASASPAGAGGASRPSRGHAHNDYVHERPLIEALERSFASIEADIFLRDGELLVGHSLPELRPERTLEGMYLEPLAKWIAKQEGQANRPASPLLLLIDIKTEGAATWEALHPLLVKYRSMLSETGEEGFQQRAVTIVISGNRAVEEILAARPQLAGIDGRMSDLGSSLQSAAMPLVSDAWSKHFRWRGSGPMPTEERQKLRELVARAHAEQRLVRFWATPELENFWMELSRAGVDLIGTDDLSRLETFLAAPPAAALDDD